MKLFGRIVKSGCKFAVAIKLFKTSLYIVLYKQNRRKLSCKNTRSRIKRHLLVALLSFIGSLPIACFNRLSTTSKMSLDFAFLLDLQTTDSSDLNCYGDTNGCTVEGCVSSYFALDTPCDTGSGANVRCFIMIASTL